MTDKETDMAFEAMLKKFDFAPYRLWIKFLLSIPVPFLNLTKRNIFYKAFSWQFGTSYVLFA